jgi:hypothetical protein
MQVWVLFFGDVRKDICLDNQRGYDTFSFLVFAVSMARYESFGVKNGLQENAQFTPH